MTESQPLRAPSLADALIPLGVLIALLALSVYLFGDDSSYGANQIALLLAMGIAGLVGWKNGYRWEHIQDAMIHGLALGTGAMFILLAVGALIGTWILSGTVPTLIHYGLAILHPSFFYPATCLLCALVALSIGSSWTTAGTLGVALMGVAAGLGMSPEITAGAIISGAYFGDKMSPLSDTTNLAPASVGGELFSHIRHMTWTTGPSFLIALVLFVLFGLRADGSSDATTLADLRDTIDSTFRVGIHLLVPLALVLWMAWRRTPAFPTIFLGALVGALFAVVFQPALTAEAAGNEQLATPFALLAGSWTALFDGFKLDTGSEALNELLQRGGMSSMLNTIWLIMCALSFGAVMERLGMLERLIRSILAAAKSTASLIIAVLLTAIGVNIVAADQYIAIVLPGRIYRMEFEKRGLAPVNLSRALEDAGTMTSVLVPWNTCGAYMAATLGVATFAYLPYAFFNLLSPLVAAALAIAGFKILRSVEVDKAPDHRQA
ncbi:MAG TPA: Na+/H+ antiporter NhaC [Xanthomonadaceae bacterium]|nr:Na+/H+ antiporter NhaC [Xanthomonadaceae bacterium]